MTQMRQWQQLGWFTAVVVAVACVVGLGFSQSTNPTGQTASFRESGSCDSVGVLHPVTNWKVYSSAVDIGSVWRSPVQTYYFSPCGDGMYWQVELVVDGVAQTHWTTQLEVTGPLPLSAAGRMIGGEK